MSLYQNNQLNYSFSSNNKIPENIEQDNKSENQSNILIQDNSYLSNNNIYSNTLNSFFKNAFDNEQKIDKLNSRLDKIFEQLVFGKQQNTSIFNYSINSKEILLNAEQNKNIQKIKKLKSKIQTLSNMFTQMKNNTKNNQNQIDNILTSFENKFNKKINQIEKQRNKNELEMNKLINQQFSNFRRNYINIEKENDKNLEDIKENISKKLGFLLRWLENEKKCREIKDEEIHRIILNKIKENENVYKNEIKITENQNESLVEYIRNNLTDFDCSLRKLKLDREMSYKKLMAIVEKTSDKIQMKI